MKNNIKIIKINSKIFSILFSLIFIIFTLSENAQATFPTDILKSTEKSELKNLTFANIVEPLIPAVVNIYTVKYKKRNPIQQKNPFSDGFPFDQFNDLFEQFNMPFGFDDSYSDPKALSLGSGFVIDASGYIVTNHHVVNNADEINVKLSDNTELPAKLIGSDSKTDLALLKVETKTPLAFVKFGDSSKVRVGDWVIAIGNPFGFGGTVTSGIVSSKGRDIDSDNMGIVDDFIQTDAAINSGNSGGPMFDMSGEVIGVNTAIISPTGLNIGIGFAIPSSTAQNIINQLKKNGKISRGKLDIVIQDMTLDLAEGFGLKDNTGVLVVEVIPQSAGDKAGIKAGDVIIEFAGHEVKNRRKLQVLVGEAPVNQDVKIKVIRDGKKIELIGKILEIEEKSNKLSQEEPSKIIEKGTIQKSGINFSNITPELKQKFLIKEGVKGILVTDTRDQKNNLLKVGDIILAVQMQEITDIDQFTKIYDIFKAQGKKNVILFIKRKSINLYVPLPLS